MPPDPSWVGIEHYSVKYFNHIQSAVVQNLLTLCTQSANILAHGMYARSAKRQYIGVGELTR